MTIKRIDIDRILTDSSMFSLKGILFRSEEQSYHDSFDKLGILNPVIVRRDGEGIHLIDGEKRIRFAKQKEMAVIEAVVLPEDTPVTDIISLMLFGRREEVASSMINRVQFICFALSLAAPEEWVLGSLCVPLGLKPHAETLRSAGRINELPEALKAFCHEKKVSFKQLVNFTSYPDDLSGLLVDWNSSLQLTASTMDEIASNLRGWVRAHNKSAGDLMHDPEIREILESAMGPRDKTERLRGLLRARQYPILSRVNSKIEKTVSGLKLPKEIHMEWDRTLENKSLGISIHINDPRKWGEMLETIGSEEVRAALQEILDEL